MRSSEHARGLSGRSAANEPHRQLGWNVASGEFVWSEETFRIFGFDPARSRRR